MRPLYPVLLQASQPAPLKNFLPLMSSFFMLQIHQHGAGDLGFFAALGADAANQTLCQDGFDRRTNHEGLDAHVFQSSHGCRRVVGVQGAEDQVAGQSGLNRDFGGLQIADLAHQNRVGVLTQNRSQTTGKRDADVRVDWNLNDAVDVVLDRILGGDQLVR